MDISIKKDLASNWFKLLQNAICDDILKIEKNKVNFQSTSWKRSIKKNEGGGEYRILKNGKIFEKGFRGSAAKKKEGTGVGLFLARKLAKQIGGELRLLANNSIDNTEKLKSLKKKNIFYLELPIKELHA